MLAPLRKKLPDPVRKRMRQIRAHFLSFGLSKKEFVQPKEEEKASADMSVIITYSNTPAAVLKRCLRSVELYACDAEVILVDDGCSITESVQLADEFANRNHWKFVRNDTTLGHSRANEIGAKEATRPYLCLLNSDTVVTPWSWRGAQKAFESDSRIGITGPTTSQTPTPQMDRKAELCRHFWTDSQVFAFAEHCSRRKNSSALVDLPKIGGFAFFIRRSLWEELGGFSLDLPDYGNEFELCHRAAERGWRMVWTPGNYIHHLGQQTYVDPTSEWL